jgi:hypothetical protein
MLMLDHPVTGPMAWSRDTILPDEGRMTIGEDVRCELLQTAELLSRNPLPITALEPADFDMPACAALMGEARATLSEGLGFCIIAGLPWDEVEVEHCKALHWLMMSMLGRTVAQKFNGEMVYDVLDTGRKEALGAGVRGSKTNRGQGYHTDNSYNLPPEYVGLTCLKTAMEGGQSGLVSFYTAHNAMLQRHPDLLSRLYEDFYFERYDEFAPGESAIASKPIFRFDGRILEVSLSTNRVRMGYAAAGETMDARTEAALKALDEVLEDPALGKVFDFEPGETQIVNNRALGHRRTAFTDWPEPDRKRHLVRIWVRNSGRRFYAG